MAISPPSDIVLDVARAAGPADIEAARAALTTRAGGAAAPGETFTVEDAGAARTTGRPAADPAKNYQRFEAMVLQTFIQSMMPKDTESVYGKGLAGDMWKSQLAERLADVMAERGGIGIAKKMLADHYLEGKRVVPVGAVSGGADQAALDKQAQLSTSLVHELQLRMVRSLSDDPAAAAPATKI
ncbi:MAG: rod-binding protein [Mesorhizobium sp.]|nr:rod-binding protein [Mesorhizobium sp.]MBN9242905.1 rod-binding protein [Mesorhizobium sp.]MBN9268873.1 rod-binding protein [Mesorhizobium sp.]